ncbi:MAG: TRAP transporter fused permease subunit [Tissierellia bacterium]|nr:TRAP transporter fused permease subunit [Tissierellia bacterium]
MVKTNNLYQNIITGLLVLWSLLQILFNTIWTIDAISLRGFHAMFLLIFAVLSYSWKKDKKDSLHLTDGIFLIAILFVFFYFLTQYNVIAQQGGFTDQRDLYIAALGMILVFALGFKVSKNLSILAFIFFAYLFLGKFIPGVLGHNGFSLKRVLNHMFWGSQGIFGVGIGVSATYIFLFVLFGAFLKYSGFSELINDLALTAVGKTPGGPAKVAVIASAVMGMINGSAVANVATTGTITIPMMKKSGYSSEFSAAVEATSSTGGQFCPPIMGAVGFLMAEFLGIPYQKVMIAAILPAFLYYFSVMVTVHLEAKKLGLQGISLENMKSAGMILKERGILLAPLILLLFMLLKGYTPIYAAVAAIGVAIISSWFVKEYRMTPQRIVEAMCEGALSSVAVGIPCILIGVIIGTVSLSSLGLNFGYLVVDTAINKYLMGAGFLVMIMSVILGMGVPGVAAYVIVVAVAVPILIKAGAEPIAAHMFCLIYACLSNITPPVAISSYVASGIAGSDMNKTSIQAVKIGIVGFVLPFFFLNNEALLLGTLPFDIQAFRFILTAILGVLSISIGFEAFYKEKIPVFFQLLLIVGGLLLINANGLTDIIGLLPLVYLVVKGGLYEKMA